MSVPYQANDKFRATTRATYIADPADSSIQVTAIPTNLPTVVTLGWNTQYETQVGVTGTSGSNSSNYALTGLTIIKGYGLTGNVPEGVAVNCLNNEIYFNQYGDMIAAIQETADDAAASAAAAAVAGLTINTITSSATPTPIVTTQRNLFTVTAQGAAGAFAAPSGTPTNGMVLLLRIKDDGTARGLTWNSIYRAIGTTLPSTTVISKTLYLGMVYNSTDSKWDVLAIGQEA